MYNTDYLPQLERARRQLFGVSGQPPDRYAFARFVPPRSIKVVPCYKDDNGELVPMSRSKLFLRRIKSIQQKIRSRNRHT